MSRVITVYGAPDCGSCKTLMADLDKRGILYSYVDVSELPIEGITSVPTMDVFDGKLQRIVGYSPKRIKEVFG